MPQLDTTQAQELVGKTISLWDGDCQVHWRILNVKQSYGVIRYEVEPIAGSGRKWINADKARLVE